MHVPIVNRSGTRYVPNWGVSARSSGSGRNPYGRWDGGHYVAVAREQ